METALGAWPMELHPYKLDDSILFLQEHDLHHPPVPFCLLLRLLRSDLIRRLLHHPIQPHLHIIPLSGPRHPLTGHKLHRQKDQQVIRLTSRRPREQPLTDKHHQADQTRPDSQALGVPPRGPVDQQVPVSIVPESVLYRAGERNLQLHELFPVAG